MPFLPPLKMQLPIKVSCEGIAWQILGNEACSSQPRRTEGRARQHVGMEGE